MDVLDLLVRCRGWAADILGFFRTTVMVQDVAVAPCVRRLEADVWATQPARLASCYLSPIVLFDGLGKRRDGCESDCLGIECRIRRARPDS